MRVNFARRRVAVVGSGIAGLAAAWRLSTALADGSPSPVAVTLFEADSHFGGHAHTVDLTLNGLTHGVDTGFLVFNHATYPGLVRLFETLAVDTAPAEMSFSVQVRQPGQRGLEWAGNNLNSVFAQRRNLLRPGFWRMLADLRRFNRLTQQLAEAGADAALDQPLADFLALHRFSDEFRDAYLLPMLGCIWSCPTEQMLRFPVATMVRFCHNHGLNRVSDRPPWFTVRGGSRRYVRKMVACLDDARLDTPVLALRRQPPDSASAGVWLDTMHGSERFDAVVLASHSEQSLAMLGTHASAQERSVLGAIRTQRNRAVLHTDARLLPTRRLAWAAWNCERAGAATGEANAQPTPICLHYLINRLQPLPWTQPVLVSLNPIREPAPALVHGEFDYAHPVFDRAAIVAQTRLPALQGRAGVWFAGAWTGYGFHEDGLRSGLVAADAVLASFSADAGVPMARAA